MLWCVASTHTWEEFLRRIRTKSSNKKYSYYQARRKLFRRWNYALLSRVQKKCLLTVTIILWSYSLTKRNQLLRKRGITLKTWQTVKISCGILVDFLIKYNNTGMKINSWTTMLILWIETKMFKLKTSLMNLTILMRISSAIN